MSTAAAIRTEHVAWALETLAIDSDASTQAVRAAIVSQLEESDFVPPLIVIEAIEALAPYAADRSPASQQDGSAQPIRVPAMAFHRHCERQLRKQVDTLAEQFFALAVPERQATWARLAQQAQPYPAIMLRLQALRPALDLLPPKISSEEHQELAEACMQLFVMRPAARAAARNALLRRCAENNWVRSAKRFARRYPPLAALAPELFEVLKARRVRPKMPPPVVVQTSNSPEVRRLMGWFLVMLIAGVLALVFIGSNARQASRRSGPPRPPTYRPLDFEMPNKSEVFPTLQEQRRQILREHKAKQDGHEEPVSAPPPDDSPLAPETIDLPPQP